MNLFWKVLLVWVDPCLIVEMWQLRRCTHVQYLHTHTYTHPKGLTRSSTLKMKPANFSGDSTKFDIEFFRCKLLALLVHLSWKHTKNVTFWRKFHEILKVESCLFTFWIFIGYNAGRFWTKNGRIWRFHGIVGDFIHFHSNIPVCLFIFSQLHYKNKNFQIA